MSDRSPPCDLDAERACIGAMCMDAAAVESVLAVIRADEAEAFYLPAHRILFAALVRLHGKGKPIDWVVVKNELTRVGKLEEAGGETYMVELADSFADTANAAHYAAIVKEKAGLRAIISAAAKAMDAAYSPLATDPAEIAAEFARGMDAVAQAAVAADAMQTATTTLNTLPEWWSRTRNSIIPTGLFPLDDVLNGGIERGTYAVIGARPSIGKSSIALIIARNAALQGIPVAYFILESTAKRTVARLVANAVGRGSAELRKALSAEQQYEAVRAANQKSAGERIWMTDRLRSIGQIVPAARSMVRKHGVGMVVVDYIQLVTPTGKHEKREREISSISAALRDLANDREVIVLALAQLNREGEAAPELRHLRESGSIENDADVAILLHRDRSQDHWQGPIDCNIAKNRDGRTGIVTMMMRPATLEFCPASGGDEFYPVPHGAATDDEVPY